MNGEYKPEINYVNRLFLFEIAIECKMCGEDKITVLFDAENKCLIFRCGNKECGYEDILCL